MRVSVALTTTRGWQRLSNRGLSLGGPRFGTKMLMATGHHGVGPQRLAKRRMVYVLLVGTTHVPKASHKPQSRYRRGTEAKKESHSEGGRTKSSRSRVDRNGIRAIPLVMLSSAC